ncbi:hypothetical protein N7449_011384 [Penicillium cf. viridicatum]|uniref:Uncharacterized protein n=1 Tax=Penicillium cf. viridicatum TaxID=2972119 RepID=A0A9W9IXJ8_9EURO|nr:hypothetical protein N7449_011384 [Penicillium cf. viridicatum]
MLARSQPLLLNFDAWDFTDIYLTQPTLVVYGDLAESKWHSERLYNKLKGKNTEVSQYVIPGGRHMDFYDHPAYVDPSVKQIADFFRQV